MPAFNRYGWTILGSGPEEAHATVNGATTFAMAALNSCVAHRFMALDSRDIKGAYVYFASVTSAGTVQLRIETIDPATGKPTGTLYDANASKSFTPAAGWQFVQFDTLPTTGMTAGTEYALVLITTGTGTTHTLRAYVVLTAPLVFYPSLALTATDGSTRSNLTEVANSIPHPSIVFEDDAEESLGFSLTTTTATFSIYGTRAAGIWFDLVASLKVLGVEAFLIKSGSPGDVRAKIFSSAGTLIATSLTVDKDILAGLSSSRRVLFHFASAVTLAAGSYRVVIEQVDHTTTSGNNYTLSGLQYRSASCRPTGYMRTETTNIDAGTVVWTDSGTYDAYSLCVGLRVADVVAASGGGSSGTSILRSGIIAGRR